MKHICKQCGKEFEGDKRRQFCSTGCATTHRNYSKTKHYKITCETCGKEFEVPEYQKDTAKFCSNECRIADLKKNNTIEPCAYCGKPVEVNWRNKKSKKKYCSQECYYKDKAAKSKVVCAGCGKEFDAYHSRISYYNKLYCSRECYQENNGLPSIPGFVKNKRWEQIRSRLASTAMYLKWRSSVLNRDGYKCSECGSTDELRVHHHMTLLEISMKYNPKFSLDEEYIQATINSKEFQDINNGITLCNSCHLKQHHS